MSLFSRSLGPPFDAGNYAPAQSYTMRSKELVVTSPFGPRYVASNAAASTNHTGVDLRAAAGTPVVAPQSGTVEIAGTLDSMCGSGIKLDHGGRYKTGYCHLREINVVAGQKVSKGQQIGRSGGGPTDPGHGNSNAAHLHFIVYDKEAGGAKVDPMQVIDFAPFLLSYKTTSQDPLGASGYDIRKRKRMTKRGFIIGGSIAGVVLLLIVMLRVRSKRKQRKWSQIASAER